MGLYAPYGLRLSWSAVDLLGIACLSKYSSVLAGKMKGVLEKIASRVRGTESNQVA